MKTLETTYLGLKLRNPIIISSSGLTNSVEKIVELEKAGAGAVVLKSLFEEQIYLNTQHLVSHSDYTEALDYVKNYVESHNLSDYLQLVKDTKSKVSIPVIASINCHKAGEWSNFAKQIELAGADAIELNIYYLNTSKQIDSESFQQNYFTIVREVVKAVNIPISVKISSQFSNIVGLSENIIACGAKSVVFFNRFYQPDIDLKTLQLKAGETFTTPSDFANTLRWLSIVSGIVKGANISATTGIHDWENAVKAILAGAQTVQICSTVYKHGNKVISEIITSIESWMEQHKYQNLEEFRGKLNYKNVENPSMYERSQFMKYYSDDKNSGEIYFS